MQTYEYKFVRLEQHKGWTGDVRPSESAIEGYPDIVQQHAMEGWRLVQIFAPGIGTTGQPQFFELILERPQQP